MMVGEMSRQGAAPSRGGVLVSAVIAGGSSIQLLGEVIPNLAGLLLGWGGGAFGRRRRWLGI